MRRYQIAAIAALWWGTVVHAQQPPVLAPPATSQQATLSLSQATAIAIQNHPQIAAARDIAATAGQRIIESKAAYYPTIDGEVTAAQGTYLGRIGAGSLSSSQLFDRFGQGIQMTQLLTDFGRTKSLVAQSQFQAQAADQITEATVYDVVLGVNRGYLGVLEAQAYLTVANETVRARQTLADQVTALANANLKSRFEVSFAEVNVSEAKLLLIRSQDAVERAWSDLSRALGQDQVVRYTLAVVPAPGALPDSPEPLIAEAIQNRPELRSLQLQLQGAQSFEQAEADLKRPVVSVVAVGGGLPYLGQDPRVAPYGYEGAAVNLDIPIFNGHLFTARRRAAHYQAETVGEHVRNLRQQVERDVRNAWISASTAYQRIPVTVQYLNQANLAIKLAQGRYDLGLATIVDVTQAQLNLTQAQIENVSATYDYQSQYAALQYTIGLLR